MLKKKKIIFDFDGVIADTERGRFDLLAELLTQFGIDLKKHFSVQNIAGTPTGIFLIKNFPSLSKKEVDTIILKRRKLLFSKLEKYCAIYLGASESIKQLKQMGFDLILATTNDEVVGEKLLKWVGINQEFKIKFFRDTIQNPTSLKKDYSLLLKKLSLDAEDCIIVEDSIIGVTSAKNNLIYCIAFNRYDNDDILKLADKTINDFKELMALFKPEK